MIICRLTCTRCSVETVCALQSGPSTTVTCRRCGNRISELFPDGGFVYVLSNPSLPGLIKVGCTERSVEDRVRELSNHSGVAAPFIEEWSCAVAAPHDAERRAHEALGDFRYALNREFFQIEPGRAVDVVSRSLSGLIIFSRGLSATEEKCGIPDARIVASSSDLEAAKKIIRSRTPEPSLEVRTQSGFGSDRYV